jgi:hypothetical protein
MTKFAIYQIQASAADRNIINTTGDYNNVPNIKAKLDMSMDFSGNNIGGMAYDAMDAGYYTHVANIEAIDYNEVFETGNIGPEENIERLGKMSSLSVGDVIVHQDGTCAVVAPMGFVAFSFRPKMAA